MKSESREGKIELILGPIYSGKSTRLIELLHKYIYKCKKTLMVKYNSEQRYSEKSEVVTHDLIKYDSIESKLLKNSFEILKQYDVIGIDGGQFFDGLVEICEELALMGKIVLIASLNGDFKMEPFPVIQRVISKSDKIKLLKAYCFNCHKDAKFNLKIEPCNKNILIGSVDLYKPVCRACHILFSKKGEKSNITLAKLDNRDNE